MQDKPRNQDKSVTSAVGHGGRAAKGDDVNRVLKVNNNNEVSDEIDKLIAVGDD